MESSLQVFTNTTSPYARLVRIALIEKGLSPDGGETLVNPWADDAELLAVNPAARVPAIVTSKGRNLTESLLILMRLEITHPQPSLVHGDVDHIMEQAGIAFGVIEASVHTLVGRLISDGAITIPNFDETPVGLRRRRTILDGLARLESSPPQIRGKIPSLDVIMTVVALDYIAFRFASSAWRTTYPKLEALVADTAGRPSFLSTRPHA